MLVLIAPCENPYTITILIGNPSGKTSTEEFNTESAKEKAPHAAEAKRGDG